MPPPPLVCSKGKDQRGTRMERCIGPSEPFGRQSLASMCTYTLCKLYLTKMIFVGFRSHIHRISLCSRLSRRAEPSGRRFEGPSKQCRFMPLEFVPDTILRRVCSRGERAGGSIEARGLRLTSRASFEPDSLPTE